jgi:CBS domain-containing protein
MNEENVTAQTVGEVMTAGVVGVGPGAPVTEAAARMRDFDIGDVLVIENDRLEGILTDRDIAIRVVAEGLDPSKTPVGDVCSSEVATVSVGTPVEEAVEVIRQHALRRLPVVDDEGRVAGVATIGDFAMANDPHSALADVSAAPPND